MKLKTTLLGKTYTFRDLKDVLAKANEEKTGDKLAGLAAETAQERIAAKVVLSEVLLSDLRENPAVPYEEDEVTRIIQDDVNEAVYRRIRNWTVSDLREWILKETTTGDDIRKLMDDNNVNSLSTSSGTGGTLSNGVTVGEARETKVRQLLIDYLGDSSEAYRQSGIFYVSDVSNIIIRNIHFVGPGSIDVGGYDLMSVRDGAHHIWIDHCRFTDGMT